MDEKRVIRYAKEGLISHLNDFPKSRLYDNQGYSKDEIKQIEKKVEKLVAPMIKKLKRELEEERDEHVVNMILKNKA